MTSLALRPRLLTTAAAARRSGQRPPPTVAAAPVRGGSPSRRAASSNSKLPAHTAAEHGDAASLRQHLQAAPTVALTEDSRGCVPLHHACTGAALNPAVLDVCLEAEPAAIGAGAGKRVGTPLHEAARHEQTTAIRRILAADPDADLLTDAEGHTPLDVAEACGHYRAADWLRAHREEREGLRP